MVRVQLFEGNHFLGRYSRAPYVKHARSSATAFETDDQLSELVALKFVDRSGVIDRQRELLS